MQYFYIFYRTILYIFGKYIVIPGHVKATFFKINPKRVKINNKLSIKFLILMTYYYTRKQSRASQLVYHNIISSLGKQLTKILKCNLYVWPSSILMYWSSNEKRRKRKHQTWWIQPSIIGLSRIVLIGFKLME